MTTYYARVDYDYTGGSKIFTIPFSYIKSEHIKILINDVEITNFTFHSASQVQVNEDLVAGDVVSIRRRTPLEYRLVNFTNTSILNKDNQNTSAQQTFNVVQELYDDNELTKRAAEDIIALEEGIQRATDAADAAEEAAERVETYGGIKSYLATETYAENDIVVGFVDGMVVLYKSLIDDNIGNPLSDTDCWEQINLGGSSLILGQSIESPIPLTDACLHLQDGTLIDGDGIYADFVEEIINKYENSPKFLNLHIVGTPTINNGVVSGFITSPATWVSIPNNLPTTFSTFEFDLKFTTGLDITTAQTLMTYGIETNKGLCIGIASGAIRTYISSNGSTWDISNDVASTLTISANTTYYMKVYFTGTAYKVDLSTDGETYTNYITISNSTTINKPSYCNFGNWYNDSTATAVNPFLGSIDCNYLKVIQDDVEAWTGMLPAWTYNECQWQAANLTYGECGKFVVDTVNNTVRIPKRTTFSQATVDESKLGDLVEAGLPNITGKISSYWGNFQPQNCTGAFNNGSAKVNAAGNGSNSGADEVYFNASASNAIYGNSTTVQPQSTKVFYYIVIATTQKQPAEVVIDNVVTDLNGKADCDLTNVNATGTSKVSHWAMPSDVYDDITVGASGASYTAPADGYYWYQSDNTINNYTFFYLTIVSSGFKTYSMASNNIVALDYLSVKKGDVVVFDYFNCTSANISLRFYYAEGTKGEA